MAGPGIEPGTSGSRVRRAVDLATRPGSNIETVDTVYIYFHFLKTIRNDVLCKSPAERRIHMKYYV